MRTRVIHNKLGHYNMIDPSEKGESYIFVFDENDKENTTVIFDYDEENAPELDTNALSVEDLIEELATFKSKEYLFAPSYNCIGEKSHDERIKIARELAEKNLLDDLAAYKERLLVKRERLDKQIDEINLKVDRLNREISYLKAEEG